MIFSGCRRLYMIVKVIIYYGLVEFIPVSNLIFPLRLGRSFLFKISNNQSKLLLGERLRLAFQSLGPIWVKFGQMLSTRHDLFSSSIIEQLIILQDKVKPFDGFLARKHIELAMGCSVEKLFDDFEYNPLASASISQVHAAKLKKNGKDVVIKVIRPDVLPVIQQDIKLMYILAKWIPKLMSNKSKLSYVDIVLEYEKILLDELNLLREMANIIQFRRNFKDSSMLYIPKVYPDYCRKNIMVMERIYGIPVNDLVQLKKQGINMKLLAERGIQLFFTQVFRDSFFHGDMHPGNIFVSYENPDNPKYISIDCGIVGSLNKRDKYYLASNFIAFFNRDYRKVAELHIDSGWVPHDTNIKDFEFAIRTVFEPTFEKSLGDISFSNILLDLFNTAKRFNMEIQPQLMLLQKTLLYVEGVVRYLYPQIDIWRSSKPYLEQWIKTQMGIKFIFKAIKGRIPYVVDRIPELPELFYYGLKEFCFLHKKLDKLILGLDIQRMQYEKSRFLFGVGVIFIIFGFFLFIQNVINYFFSFFLIFIGIISWIFSWKKIT